MGGEYREPCPFLQECLAFAWRGREHKDRCPVLEVRNISGWCPGQHSDSLRGTGADYKWL